MKTCSKCSFKKTLDNFFTDNKRVDKKASRCKSCMKNAFKEWYEKNKHLKQEQRKEYKQRPGVKARAWEMEKRRRERNKEQHLAKRREWRNKNKEKENRRKREWGDKNKSYVLEYVKKHKLKNRERYTHYQLQRKAKQMNAEGSYTLQEFQNLKKKYKNQCLKCGKPEGAIKITADHVTPLSKGGTNSIENIQPLCAPCNFEKHAKTADYRH